MAITLPAQLKNENFRFCKVAYGAKNPIEDEWPNQEYSYSDAEDWLAHGFNVGILGGRGDLLIIDADKKEIEARVLEILPDTFTVRSGGRDGKYEKKHFYYFCKDFPRTISLNKDGINYGHLRWLGSQTLTCGSLHPEGRIYEVFKDIPIASLDSHDVIAAFKDDYISVSDLIGEDIRKEQGFSFNFKKPSSSILDILPKDIKLKRIKEFELQGSHPVHGSEGGTNFCINVKDNVFYCFRHNAGGGILHLIAQIEKIINCGETLEGENYKKAQEIAREKYGVFRNSLTNRESVDDIRGKEILPLKFYIGNNFIAEEQRVIIGGDNETLKTMLALNMTLKMQCGLPQLFEDSDKFPVTKVNVVYIDAEKQQRLRELRTKAMIEAKNLHCDMDIFVEPDEFDLADKDSRLSLERLITELKPKVIIIDSITSAWSGKEGDKEAVNELTRYFNKLIAEYHITIVLVKLIKKPQGEHYIEPKHMIAGSYWWGGWADNIIYMAKNAAKQIVVSQEKNKSTEAKFNNFIIAPTNTCWLKFVTEFSAEERVSATEVLPLFKKLGKAEVTIRELASAAKALNLKLSRTQIKIRIDKAIQTGLVQKVNEGTPKGTAGIFKLTGNTGSSTESNDLSTEEAENGDL